TAIGICFLLLSCASAHADPIAVTGGSMSVTGFSGSYVFSLQGDGLSLMFTAESDQFLGLKFCFPCSATGDFGPGGTGFDFNGNFSAPFVGGASPAVVNGTSYGNVF